MISPGRRHNFEFDAPVWSEKSPPHRNCALFTASLLRYARRMSIIFDPVGSQIIRDRDPYQTIERRVSFFIKYIVICRWIWTFFLTVTVFIFTLQFPMFILPTCLTCSTFAYGILSYKKDAVTAERFLVTF